MLAVFCAARIRTPIANTTPMMSPQKSPVPTKTRSLVAARVVVVGPAMPSGDRTARSLASLELVVGWSLSRPRRKEGGGVGDIVTG